MVRGRHFFPLILRTRIPQKGSGLVMPGKKNRDRKSVHRANHAFACKIELTPDLFAKAASLLFYFFSTKYLPMAEHSGASHVFSPCPSPSWFFPHCLTSTQPPVANPSFSPNLFLSLSSAVSLFQWLSHSHLPPSTSPTVYRYFLVTGVPWFRSTYYVGTIPPTLLRNDKVLVLML